jgi:O-antigen/teichoic acid export membrane protein
VVVVLVCLTGRYDFAVYFVVLIVGLNKVVEATSDIGYGVLQKQDRLDKVAQSLVIRNAGALILLVAVLKLTGNLVCGVSVVGGWWLLVFLSFDRRNVKCFDDFVARFPLRTILVLLLTGLPLGIVRGIITLNANIPRYFVEGYLGTENLACFGAMSYVVVGASRASIALSHSATAPLARYYCSNRKAYVRLLVKIVLLAFLLAGAAVLFAVIFGRSFLAFVYGIEYAKHPDVFAWLMAAAGLSMVVSMLNCGMMSARCFKSQMPVFCLTCVVCLFASWLLIPNYGMKGAAWAILLTMVTQGLGGVGVIIWALSAPATSNEGGQ